MFAVLLLKAQWASKVDRMSNIPVGLVPVLAGDYCTSFHRIFSDLFLFLYPYSAYAYVQYGRAVGFRL